MPGFLCVMLDFGGLALVIPILPYLAITLDASAFEVTALLGLYSVGQFFSNIICGKGSDMIGRRPVILTSILGSNVFYILCAIAGKQPPKSV